MGFDVRNHTSLPTNMAGVVVPEGSNIKIRVKSNCFVDPEVLFRMKRNTPLRKLMNAYCEFKGITQPGMSFLYYGKRIKPEDTPHQLGMKDGDKIDFILHQIAGGYGRSNKM